jgi:bifunctional non-homologous end joining protein LigD
VPPEWVPPMLATLTKRRFSDKGWVFETKFDGVRGLAFRSGKKVSLYSRNHLPMDRRYPEVTAALAAQKPKDFIVDGEIVTFADEVTSFSALQKRMKNEAPSQALLDAVPVYFYLFDLLYLDGRDLRDRPLVERKALLKSSFRFTGPLRFSTHLPEKGEEYFAAACARGWEGLIAKRADSPYVSMRSDDWLKFKCVRSQEFVIGGYTDPQRSREGFGALLLGYYQDKKFLYAGKVGTGFNDESLRSLGKKLKALGRKHSPYEERVAEERKAHWVKPELIAQVEFTEWTPDGHLRHPSFLGLRDDKPPQQIQREER